MKAADPPSVQPRSDAASHVTRSGLRVAAELADFVERDALDGLPLASDRFWTGFADLLKAFAPRNRELLACRDAFQQRIDGWLRARRLAALPPSGAEQEGFLHEIGYLQTEGEPFTIGVTGLDPEIDRLAGPQLVVPLSNPRYVLNAVNARWGSLYDALYGTDAIPEDQGRARGGAYNPKRGEAVIAYGRRLLDEAAPLARGSHADAAGYRVEGGLLVVDREGQEPTGLAAPEAFQGFCGAASAPEAILLRHHGLHIEIVIDREHRIGRDDRAGVADICVEAALTTIMDLEDSVAAVDAADKVALYRTMLALTRGDLVASFEKDGRTMKRAGAGNRIYTGSDGRPLELSGRSLVLYRNVGHLTTTDAVLLPTGEEAPEGILDGAITALIGLRERAPDAPRRNSATGATYIVKPKMHGPDEAAFANDLFDALEDLVGIPRHTLKIGVMDEERRTSANLKECVRQVKDRIFFINTGFLDRTGDDIHTNMQAGSMAAKGAMRSAAWFAAYEDRNVAIGLNAGFAGRAQIGKGMWAMPDRMADMLAAKIAHPRAGANAAWVPSPTAAVLHALHYHATDVADRQARLNKAPPPVSDLLTVPLGDFQGWSSEQLRAEIENNCQSILGYVVRWIDQGIGCSKVPDIHDVGLMEDRATLRISSQILANWLMHGVCTGEQVEQALRRMAAVVDAQNAHDPCYAAMAPGFDGNLAFQCARDLIFKGAEQPNGYTEPLLHAYRQAYKAAHPPI